MLREVHVTGERPVSRSRVSADRGVRAALQASPRWLHDHAQAGMTLDAQMPRGRFTFDVASPRPAVLVSAGIGITPMVAMLRRALADGTPSRRVVFVHGAREAADRPFAAELARSAAADARVSLHWFDSHPDASGTSYTFVQRGTQRHQGIELGAAGRVTERLGLTASVAAIRARAVDSGSPAYEGHQIINVPALRASLYADYAVPGVAGLNVLGGVEYSAARNANEEGTAR
ncbi:TonB-dependent receptor, partial [Burkholderia cenocepacia]|nr:TonB-dependent receptor [Burkholderia cenocepacia]MDR5668100.1 TonB-dependent receptor [Burkholderia cenocepacia]